MTAPERKMLAHNGGLPTGNYPKEDLVEYVRADIHAAALDRIAELEGFIEEFASAKIDALRYSMPYGSSPEDEPDPVVDAETVWAWQADARAVITPAPTGQEGA